MSHWLAYSLLMRNPKAFKGDIGPGGAFRACFVENRLRMAPALALLCATSLTGGALEGITLLTVQSASYEGHQLLIGKVEELKKMQEATIENEDWLRLHRCILGLLLVLFVVDVGLTGFVAPLLFQNHVDVKSSLKLFIYIQTLSYSIQLWTALAGYSLEIFDRYVGPYPLKQSVKERYYIYIDIVVHLVRCMNNLVISAAMITAADFGGAPRTFLLLQSSISSLSSVRDAVRCSKRSSRLSSFLPSLIARLPSPDRSKDSEGAVHCAICREDDTTSACASLPFKELPDPYCRLRCSHVYHRECLSLWFEWRMECPTCRSADVTF